MSETVTVSTEDLKALGQLAADRVQHLSNAIKAMPEGSSQRLVVTPNLEAASDLLARVTAILKENK